MNRAGGWRWSRQQSSADIRNRVGWNRTPGKSGARRWTRPGGFCLGRMRGVGSIVGLGLTNQRETTIVWERKTGKPVAPAIVWQCRRTADFCNELASYPKAAEITQKTGLVIDAYFSGSKIHWILTHVPDARRKALDGELLFGTVDTWLIWKLTNGAVHVTDYSNASRTLLMDLSTGEWDADLLDTFGVPRAMLPRIVAIEQCSWRGGERASGSGDSDCRDRGRSAGRTVRTGVFSAGIVQEHVWDGMFCSDPHRFAPAGVEEQAAGDASSVGGRSGICDRRCNLHRRCSDPVAARQTGDYSDCSRERGAGWVGQRRGWSLFRAGVRRLGGAALGFGSSRNVERNHGCDRAGRTWRGRHWRRLRIKPENWWRRWRPMEGKN